MFKGATTLLSIAAFILIVTSACDREGSQDLPPKKTDKIVFAVTPWPASAALYVAQEKGYFNDEGIHADLHPYLSGHLGLEAVLSGKADLVTVGDTPLARAAIKGKPIAVIATLCEINRAVLIVARKDRGISSRADLEGKKIGVVAGTTADFFLHIFLTTSYIDFKAVRIVNLETDMVVDALVRGEVDAVSTWSPHTILARDKLGDNAVILEDPSIYKMTWNITAAKDFAERHPQGIRKVLRAIVRANAFTLDRPQEAHEIASKNIGTASPLLEKEWEDYAFTVALDQSLLLNLEDQARWMIGTGDGTNRIPPNFMDFIYADGLKAVQPAAVGITGR